VLEESAGLAAGFPGTTPAAAARPRMATGFIFIVMVRKVLGSVR
jgi:hypothetical protein